MKQHDTALNNSKSVSMRDISVIFFFNDTATTEIYTLSLHDALPISSCTSWSSKIMAEGTVERSHLIVGSFQESQYRRVYSSKSATSRPGGFVGSRRELMNSRVPGETSSA